MIGFLAIPPPARGQPRPAALSTRWSGLGLPILGSRRRFAEAVSALRSLLALGGAEH